MHVRGLSKGQWVAAILVKAGQEEDTKRGWDGREVLECNKQKRKCSNLEFFSPPLGAILSFLFAFLSLLWVLKNGPEGLNFPMPLSDRGSPNYHHHVCPDQQIRSYLLSPYHVPAVCLLLPSTLCSLSIVILHL